MMPVNLRLRWLAALLILGVLSIAIPAEAQTEIVARLLLPQTAAFPRIQVYMDVHDAQGGFVHGVEVGEVHILENGQVIPLTDFSAVQPGVQTALVISPGGTFAIRNSQGASRYDLIRLALVDWLKSRRGSTVDDLSLLIANGPEVTHAADPEQILADLEPYEPDYKAANPGLETLIRAMDVAADASPRPGMERAVLFITAPVQGDIAVGLETLITRAREQSIRIFIWLVASPDAFNTPAAQLLRRLSEQTGGGFFTFSSEESIPSPESFLGKMRDIYQLTYVSRITAGGPQQLVVDIQRGAEDIKSEPLDFNLDLRAPEPMFIAPSLEIRRGLGQGAPANPWKQVKPEDLLPKTQALQLLVDFPDGRPRLLKRTALYVDGKLIEEHTAAPYDTFTWDLSAYSTSGQHILQAEAQDELGLTGRSIETPVEISVQNPAGNPLFALLGHWPALAGLGVILAASFALLVLVLSGRIRPQVFGKPLGFRRRQRPTMELASQPAMMQADGTGRNLSGWVNRLHWPQRRLSPKALAYLTAFSEAAQASTEAPLPISAAELTLGRDPNRATLVFDDPSVDALHARLTRSDDDSYRLTDEGSVAGTWVNFELVPAGGVVLAHGDLIHIGRIGFRFTQRVPSHPARPVVMVQEPYA